MESLTISSNPYILLPPGPMTTTRAVKTAMEMNLYTWDNDYSQMVQAIRNDLVKLATSSPGFTSVLMEGSGTFCVEAALTTAVGKSGKVVILSNGTYGTRMAQICTICGIQFIVQESDEMYPPDMDQLATLLATDQEITHVAVAHCETSTGMLNPIHEIGIIAKRFGKIYIVDAMASFGRIPMDIAAIKAHFLVGSTNKWIQGVASNQGYLKLLMPPEKMALLIESIMLNDFK